MLRRLLLGQRKRDENEEKNKIVSTNQKDDEKKSESADECESESEESESESMEDSSTCSLDESFEEYDKVQDWEGFKMAEGHDVTKRELLTLINDGNSNGDVKGMSRAKSSMEQREDVGTMRIQKETMGNAVAGSKVCEEQCDDDSKNDLKTNKENEIDKEKILSGAHCGQDKKEYEKLSLNALNNDENEPGDNGDNNKNEENNSSNMNNNDSSISSSNNSRSSSENNDDDSRNSSDKSSGNSSGNASSSDNSNNDSRNNNVNTNNSNNHNSNLEKFTKAPNENTQTSKSNPNEQNAKENLTTKSTANTKPAPYVTPISTNRKTSPGISRHYSFNSTEKHSTPGGVNNHTKTYQQKTPGGSRNTPGKGARILRTQSFNYGGNDETKQDRQARNARDRVGTGGIARDKVGTEGIARDKVGTGGITRDKVGTGGIKDRSLIKSNQARDVYRNTAVFKRGQRDTKKTMVTTKTSKTTKDFQKNISISALEESLGLNISELREIIKTVKIEQRQKGQKANQCDDKNGTIVEGTNPETQGTPGNRGENNGSTKDRVSQDLGDISKDVQKSKELDEEMGVVDGHLVEPRRSPDGCHSDGRKIEGRVERSKDEISSDSGVSETDANSTERQRYISIKAIKKRKEYLKKEIENLDARVVVMAEHKKDVQFVHDLFDLYSDGLKDVERNNVGVPCVPSLKGIMDCQLREMTDGEFAGKMKELENLGVPYFTEIQDHVEKLREKIHQSLEDDRKCRSKGVQKLRFEMGRVLGMCEGLLDCVYHE